jgi:hypothetical protein
MLAFKSTLFVAVNPPEFPEFITKFDPSIKLPYLHDMHGIYKPASQELTIIRKQEEIIKTVIKDNQINVTVPFTLALKEDIKDYIEYIFFDHERLFKWFAEQDHDNGNILSIATRLMIDEYCRTDVSPTIKLAFEGFEQGISHPSTTSRIIHDGDEFIVLTDGYFMRMVVEHEKNADLKVYKVIRQCLLEPTMKTYQECYEIGQWLNSKQNKISGDER